MFYYIDNKISSCNFIPGKNFVGILSTKEAQNYNVINKYLDKLPMLFMNVNFSKIEIFSDFIYACISIPNILIPKHVGFSFIYTDNGLIFIDNSDYISTCFDKLLETCPTNLTNHQLVLYHMLDFLIAKDFEKMNVIQQELALLEKDILDNINQKLLCEITNYRSDTMKLHHYYIQLSGMCFDLKDNTSDLFDVETRNLLDVLTKKANLLTHEAQQVWEYTSQIRDVYQQGLDVRQNSIMTILTIVTTIFMPLTLITGWYGMNFHNMPELSSPYGYPLIIVISLIVIIVLCFIFRKKHWF